MEDRQYCASLRRRLLEGTAGRMELLLWQYAFGGPRRDQDQGEDDHEAYFRAMRQAVLARLASQDRVSLLVLEALNQGVNLDEALRRVGLRYIPAAS